MEFDIYNEFIYVRSYSRWIENKKRRETWNESIDRYKDFFIKRVPEKYKDEYLKAIELFRNLDIVGSMRALWTAGPALERENVAGYNCLSGDTLILTKEEGITPIKNIIGEATILDGKKEWVKCKVKSFGVQDTYEIKFGYNSHNSIIRCTLDHDWILDSGKRIKTKDLKKGDVVSPVLYNRKKYDSIDYTLGIIHGIIYGDGTSTYKDNKICGVFKQKRLKGYHIRLCGPSVQLLKWFKQIDGKICYPPSYNGDPVVILYNNFAKTHPLKELPAKEETEDYLIGFFRGWFAADGYVSKQPSICVDDKEADWLEKNLSQYGYVFTRRYKLPIETNFGNRKKESINFYIARWSLTKEDMLLDYKKDRLEKLNIKYSFRGIIENSKKTEEVFCAIVPTTNSFVLQGGLLTGNCSFLVIDNFKAFSEIIYILMNGTGVGFNVQRKHTDKLPVIPYDILPSEETIIFKDSKRGWAEGFYKFIVGLYEGKIYKCDYSKIRPLGSPLKVFGGRASGPEPLKALIEFTKTVVTNNKGRKLSPLNCHDICCYIANVVVSGGTRRSACISLSDLEDDRMAKCKSGAFWNENQQRALANISTYYEEKPSVEKFILEWLKLIESKTGERGIINGEGLRLSALKTGRRNPDQGFGVNPCSEINLIPQEFCNLSEIIIRSGDTLETLKTKVKYCTILGIVQSTLTDFNFINRKWKKNCEEERLLGVSLTGLADHPILNSVSREAKKWLHEMKEEALNTAEDWSKILEINMPASITTVKPSGTVSALAGTSSGIHTRFAPYYIRRVMVAKTDPLCNFLLDKNITAIPENGKTFSTSTSITFEFPIKSPEKSKFKDEVSALQQLEYWKMVKESWCEHNVSCTIYVNEEEWLDVGAWVYKNWNNITGLSFLPNDNIYKNAPFEEITEDEYGERMKTFPKSIDFSELSKYELEDMTEGSKEYACVGDKCLI